MSAKDYLYPVYATQGGGLAKQSGDRYVFIESPPNFPSLNVGDLVPEDWSIVAANAEARDVADQQLWPSDYMGHEDCYPNYGGGMYDRPRR